MQRDRYTCASAKGATAHCPVSLLCSSVSFFFFFFHLSFTVYWSARHITCLDLAIDSSFQFFWGGFFNAYMWIPSIMFVAVRVKV